MISNFAAIVAGIPMPPGSTLPPELAQPMAQWLSDSDAIVAVDSQRNQCGISYNTVYGPVNDSTRFQASVFAEYHYHSTNPLTDYFPAWAVTAAGAVAIPPALAETSSPTVADIMASRLSQPRAKFVQGSY